MNYIKKTFKNRPRLGVVVLSLLACVALLGATASVARAGDVTIDFNSFSVDPKPQGPFLGGEEDGFVLSWGPEGSQLNILDLGPSGAPPMMGNALMSIQTSSNTDPVLRIEQKNGGLFEFRQLVAGYLSQYGYVSEKMVLQGYRNNAKVAEQEIDLRRFAEHQATGGPLATILIDRLDILIPHCQLAFALD